jgi:hypothetical protein
LFVTGFVEFDDVNSRVLTYNASTLTYRVWDLKTYTEIFRCVVVDSCCDLHSQPSRLCSICDSCVAEIKVSTGVMLLMYSRPPGHSILPIKLVSVVDGAHLRSIRVRLLSNDKVDFLELCNDRLLVKQKHHALQVLNVFDGHVNSVPASVFKSPEVRPPQDSSFFPHLSFIFPNNIAFDRIALTCNHPSVSRRSYSFSTQGRFLPPIPESKS